MFQWIDRWFLPHDAPASVAPSRCHSRCNIYCQGDIHAIESLFTANATAEAIKAFPFFTVNGWEVLTAKPALEVDIEAWRQLIECAAGLPCPPRSTTPWLVFARNIL